MKKRVLDFDNFMAEKNEDPIIVKVYGEEYKVKPEIPAIVPVMMARSNEELNETDASRMVLRAGDILFGKKVIDHFCEMGMSVENLGNLIRSVFDSINGKGIDDDDTETISDEDGMVAASGSKAKK